MVHFQHQRVMNSPVKMIGGITAGAICKFRWKCSSMGRGASSSFGDAKNGRCLLAAQCRAMGQATRREAILDETVALSAHHVRDVSGMIIEHGNLMRDALGVTSSSDGGSLDSTAVANSGPWGGQPRCNLCVLWLPALVEAQALYTACSFMPLIAMTFYKLFAPNYISGFFTYFTGFASHKCNHLSRGSSLVISRFSVSA